MALEAFFTQGGSFDAAEMRRLLGALHYAPAPGGVISGLNVVQGGGSTVKVNPGCSFVLDTTGGAYMGQLAAQTAAIAITPVSTTPRTDTVYQLIQDPGSGGTAGEPAYLVAVGTTTIPALAVPLARVTANVGGTLTIVDVRVQAQQAADVGSDTGWYALTLLNGWTIGIGSVYGPQVRTRGNAVWLRATIAEPNITGRNADPSDWPFTLPTAYVPLYDVPFVAYTSAGRGSGEVGTPIAYGVIAGSLSGTPGKVVLGMPISASAETASLYVSYVLG